MKITIITVVKNAEKTISQTIESVLNQTYDEIEYIIIDGLSTDNTMTHVNRFEPLFNGRMKIISEPDDGVYSAINKGINLAKGKVIGLLHADDFFTSPTVVEQIAKAFNKSWIDVVYGDISYVRAENLDKIIRRYSARKFTPVRLRHGFAPPHPAMYCKARLFKTYGVYKENYVTAADFEMFVRLFTQPKVFSKYLPVDIVTMRMDGLSSKWKHRLTTNIFEKRRALRENNIKVSLLSLCRKYYYVLNP